MAAIPVSATTPVSNGEAGESAGDDEEAEEEEPLLTSGTRSVLMPVVAIALLFGGVLGIIAVVMLRGNFFTTEEVVEEVDEGYPSTPNEAVGVYSEAAYRKAYDSIERWTNFKTVKKLMPKSYAFEVELVHVWSPPDESPRRVYVELKIAAPKAAKQPLIYSTWNASPAKGWPGAILVDADGAICPLVPVKDTIEIPRQDGEPWQLFPGQELGDFLVFEHTGTEIGDLELMLNYACLDQGNRYLGFRIPQEMVAAKKRTQDLGTRYEPAKTRVPKRGEFSAEEFDRQLRRMLERDAKKEAMENP